MLPWQCDVQDGGGAGLYTGVLNKKNNFIMNAVSNECIEGSVNIYAYLRCSVNIECMNI